MRKVNYRRVGHGHSSGIPLSPGNERHLPVNHLVQIDVSCRNKADVKGTAPERPQGLAQTPDKVHNQIEETENALGEPRVVRNGVLVVLGVIYHESLVAGARVSEHQARQIALTQQGVKGLDDALAQNDNICSESIGHTSTSLYSSATGALEPKSKS